MAIYLVREKFTMDLDSNNSIENFIIQHGVWEHAVTLTLDALVKTGFTCVDVGANSGYHTLDLASRVGDSGRVFAFEPNPRIFKRLAENVHRNPSLKKRIALYELGASNTPGQYFAADAGPVGNGVVRNTESEARAIGCTSQCTCVTLDEILGSQSINLIKVDVEGMEYEVLLGAREIIKRNSPLLMFETITATSSREKLAQLEVMLVEHGYYFFSFDSVQQKMAAVSIPDTPYFDALAIHEKNLFSIANIAAVAGKGILYDHFGSRQSEITLLSPRQNALSLQTTVDGKNVEVTLSRDEHSRGLSFSNKERSISIFCLDEASIHNATSRFYALIYDKHYEIREVRGRISSELITQDRQWTLSCTREELYKTIEIVLYEQREKIRASSSC